MPAVVLGINHNSPDSAAALLVDGVPVAVAEEERFIRLVLSRGATRTCPPSPGCPCATARAAS
ncbi:MAG TPA: hypothetical protein VK649_01550 [Candidatus Elarobacter sp.]|jgi:predicted NodU family carbamoyl transferase|nr:hypothetical protein [Candidatus Elarobacter sp.]